MSGPSVFTGAEDVVAWIVKVKAKLLSKGYKNQLANNTRPNAGDARLAWDALADKALGTITTYIAAEIVTQFEDKLTPQELLDAIKAHYKPDDRQEIDRLEEEFNSLEYNGEDPVV